MRHSPALLLALLCAPGCAARPPDRATPAAPPPAAPPSVTPPPAPPPAPPAAAPVADEASSSRPPPAAPPPEPPPPDGPRLDAPATSVDPVSTACRVSIERVRDRPCKTALDCKLAPACEHDDVTATCLMRGPPAAGGHGVPRFCAVARQGGCDPPWVIQPDGRKRYKRECVEM